MPTLPLAAAVALALVTTGPGPELLAMSFPPVEQMNNAGLPSDTEALVISALPSAPDRVYLETRTYGTVMVDHRAHLQRRVACKACHGPGVVSHIEFTPRSAHDSCRACHAQAKRGPTECRSCHVQTPGPPVVSPDERVRFVYRGPNGERVASATSSRAIAAKSAATATAEPAKPPEPPRLVPGADTASFSAEQFADARSAQFRTSR